jgi:hypothetical protein
MIGLKYHKYPALSTMNLYMPLLMGSSGGSAGLDGVVLQHVGSRVTVSLVVVPHQVGTNTDTATVSETETDADPVDNSANRDVEVFGTYFIPIARK